MIEHTYTEPVSKLLTLDEPEIDRWTDYLQMGFTRADIPELIRLLEDKELRWMKEPDELDEDDEHPEWYTQIHAWRALAQLKSEEAIPALLGILHEIDDHQDEWYGEESFEVFPMIGPAAIRPLAEYLEDATHGTYARIAASASLVKMAETHPEAKEECTAVIVSALHNYLNNNEELNGCMISDLIKMNAAREHLGLIEEAFKENRVDTFFDGDFEDIQIKLGLKEKRSKPHSNPVFFKGDRMVVDKSHPIIQNEMKKIKKEKSKHKQEKKSRKRNRKR